ncbi:hypothetical protein IG193_06835 [Infirmifilum lucidum]|uniref:ArsR family transcriptional regulator n=1 Tax=Infirmifilum lucidum TaxID=2776706 RepID=A0A7L9FI80_9CREN|nr:hypothetical protein [Infirmifilum lucidum]QOJ78465.1 hypothetical protein IG193_06835 [Infirmifilum lucidum]
MRAGGSYSASDDIEEEFASLVPRRSQGYLRVFVFFVKKYLEDPSQAFSAYAVEKEVASVSRARPILDWLARKGYLKVVEAGPVTYYRLNTEKRIVRLILDLFKQS